MKLSTGNSETPAVVAERGEVHLLDDLLVHVVGHLNLGHLRLSNLAKKIILISSQNIILSF